MRCCWEVGDYSRSNVDAREYPKLLYTGTICFKRNEKETLVIPFALSPKVYLNIYVEFSIRANRDIPTYIHENA